MDNGISLERCSFGMVDQKYRCLGRESVGIINQRRPHRLGPRPFIKASHKTSSLSGNALRSEMNEGLNNAAHSFSVCEPARLQADMRSSVSDAEFCRVREDDAEQWLKFRRKIGRTKNHNMRKGTRTCLEKYF